MTNPANCRRYLIEVEVEITDEVALKGSSVMGNADAGIEAALANMPIDFRAVAGMSELISDAFSEEALAAKGLRLVEVFGPQPRPDLNGTYATSTLGSLPVGVGTRTESAEPPEPGKEYLRHMHEA